MQWQRHDVVGTPPIRRSAHAAAIVDGKFLYIFGGWDGSVELGDLHRLDLLASPMQWTRVATTGEAPAPRHFHNMVALNRRLYVFGGFDGTRWRSDVVALDLDSLSWVTVEPAGGTSPGARASSTLTVLDSDKLLLFAGYDGDDFLDDLWVLHTVDPRSGQYAYLWERIAKPPSPPSSAGLGSVVTASDATASATGNPRQNAAAAATQPAAPPSATPTVTSAATPQKALTEAIAWPEARSGHAAEMLGPLLFVFGGRHRAGRFNDVNVLNTVDWTWMALNPSGEAFKPRKTHALARVGHRFCLFGGHDGEKWMCDFHVLDVAGLLMRPQSAPSRKRRHLANADGAANLSVSSGGAGSSSASASSACLASTVMQSTLTSNIPPSALLVDLSRLLPDVDLTTGELRGAAAACAQAAGVEWRVLLPPLPSCTDTDKHPAVAHNDRSIGLNFPRVTTHTNTTFKSSTNGARGIADVASRSQSDLVSKDAAAAAVSGGLGGRSDVYTYMLGLSSGNSAAVAGIARPVGSWKTPTVPVFSNPHSYPVSYADTHAEKSVHRRNHQFSRLDRAPPPLPVAMNVDVDVDSDAQVTGSDHFAFKSSADDDGDVCCGGDGFDDAAEQIYVDIGSHDTCDDTEDASDRESLKRHALQRDLQRQFSPHVALAAYLPALLARVEGARPASALSPPGPFRVRYATPTPSSPMFETAHLGGGNVRGSRTDSDHVTNAGTQGMGGYAVRELPIGRQVEEHVRLASHSGSLLTPLLAGAEVRRRLVDSRHTDAHAHTRADDRDRDRAIATSFTEGDRAAEATIVQRVMDAATVVPTVGAMGGDADGTQTRVRHYVGDPGPDVTHARHVHAAHVQQELRTSTVAPEGTDNRFARGEAEGADMQVDGQDVSAPGVAASASSGGSNRYLQPSRRHALQRSVVTGHTTTGAFSPSVRPAISVVSQQAVQSQPLHGAPHFTDVAIVLADGVVRIRAHRAVLSARCHYFATLFSGKYIESAYDEVVLEDVDVPTAIALLRYVYIDQLPPPTELDVLVVPLLAAAQRLMMPRLSALMQRHLEAHLAVDVAPAMLELADTLAAAALRNSALSYVLRYYSEVSMTPAFVRLREDLLREVLAARVRASQRETNAARAAADAASQALKEAEVRARAERQIATATAAAARTAFFNTTANLGAGNAATAAAAAAAAAAQTMTAVGNSAPDVAAGPFNSQAAVEPYVSVQRRASFVHATLRALVESAAFSASASPQLVSAAEAAAAIHSQLRQFTGSGRVRTGPSATGAAVESVMALSGRQPPLPPPLPRALDFAAPTGAPLAADFDPRAAMVNGRRAPAAASASASSDINGTMATPGDNGDARLAENDNQGSGRLGTLRGQTLKRLRPVSPTDVAYLARSRSHAATDGNEHTPSATAEVDENMWSSTDSQTTSSSLRDLLSAAKAARQAQHSLNEQLGTPHPVRREAALLQRVQAEASTDRRAMGATELREAVGGPATAMAIPLRNLTLASGGGGGGGDVGRRGDATRHSATPSLPALATPAMPSFSRDMLVSWTAATLGGGSTSTQPISEAPSSLPPASGNYINPTASGDGHETPAAADAAVRSNARLGSSVEGPSPPRHGSKDGDRFAMPDTRVSSGHVLLGAAEQVADAPFQPNAAQPRLLLFQSTTRQAQQQQQSRSLQQHPEAVSGVAASISSLHARPSETTSNRRAFDAGDLATIDVHVPHLQSVDAMAAMPPPQHAVNPHVHTDADSYGSPIALFHDDGTLRVSPEDSTAARFAWGAALGRRSAGDGRLVEQVEPPIAWSRAAAAEWRRSQFNFNSSADPGRVAVGELGSTIENHSNVSRVEAAIAGAPSNSLSLHSEADDSRTRDPALLLQRRTLPSQAIYHRAQESPPPPVDATQVRHEHPLGTPTYTALTLTAAPNFAASAISETQTSGPALVAHATLHGAGVHEGQGTSSWSSRDANANVREDIASRVQLQRASASNARTEVAQTGGRAVAASEVKVARGREQLASSQLTIDNYEVGKSSFVSSSGRGALALSSDEENDDDDKQQPASQLLL